MSKQEIVKVLVEKVLADGTAKREWTPYFPNGPAKEYAKGTKANYEAGLREGLLLSIKINDQDYWDLDPSTKNPPPQEKPKSNSIC